MEHYNEHLTAGIATARAGDVNIRRQAGTKRKRVSHDPQDLPWTASRCNRLLRSLTSRISILQKLAAANRLHITPDAKAGSIEASKWPTVDADLDTPSKDPAWLPGAKHGLKVSTKTYAGKATTRRAQKYAAAANERTASDQLHFPTPLVKRMMRRESSLENSESEGYPEEHSKPVVRPRGKPGRVQLPVRATSLADEANRNLVTALEGFLIATKAPATRSRSGATSLMSMCLRKVPEYVKSEEKTLTDESGDDDDERRDVMGEVYADLEGLGTANDGGWSGLREVVRADGIAKICDAMRADLLPKSTIHNLITVCSKAGAAREAQALIQTKLCRKYHSGHALLENLYMLPAGGDDDGFRLRSTRLLIDTCRVTLSDVLGSQSVCKSIMQSMAQPGDLCEAAMLLRACFTSLLEDSRPADAKAQRSIDKVLERIAVILTALASTCHVGDDNSAALQSVCLILHNLTADAHQRFVYEPTEDDESPGLETSKEVASVIPIMLGSMVLMATGNDVMSTMQHPSLAQLSAVTRQIRASEALDKAKRQYQLTGDDFLSQVATCLARWSPGAGHTFLEDSCRSFLRLATTARSTDAEFFRALALNNAANYAHAVNDKDSILVAEEIECLVLQEMPSISARTPKRTPKPKKSKPEKYRWEDGVCEWILKTPLLPKTNFNEPSHNSGLPKSPVSSHGQQMHHTVAPPPTEDPIDSEYDELAFSAKKPKRSADTRHCARAEHIRHTQTFGRHSSGSSTLNEDTLSDDELMLGL